MTNLVLLFEMEGNRPLIGRNRIGESILRISIAERIHEHVLEKRKTAVIALEKQKEVFFFCGLL